MVVSIVLAVEDLDWLDFKVKPDQGEHETLQILHQVVKCSESVGVSRSVDI